MLFPELYVNHAPMVHLPKLQVPPSALPVKLVNTPHLLLVLPTVSLALMVSTLPVQPINAHHAHLATSPTAQAIRLAALSVLPVLIPLIPLLALLALVVSLLLLDQLVVLHVPLVSTCLMPMILNAASARLVNTLLPL
jgi:hypothetical protein